MTASRVELDAAPPARRPAEITVVVVLAYINGIVDIVSGVLLILARYLPEADDDPGFRLFVTIAGAATVLLGFLTIAAASGLTRAENASRIIITVLVAVGLVLSIIAVITSLDDLWFQLINVAVSAAIIVALWTGRAARYFGRRTS